MKNTESRFVLRKNLSVRTDNTLFKEFPKSLFVLLSFNFGLLSLHAFQLQELDLFLKSHDFTSVINFVRRDAIVLHVIL